MGRWDPLPPTPVQRWIARHVRGLQCAYALLVVVCVLLGAAALADGDGRRAFVPFLTAGVFLIQTYTVGQLASWVRAQEPQRERVDP